MFIIIKQKCLDINQSYYKNSDFINQCDKILNQNIKNVTIDNFTINIQYDNNVKLIIFSEDNAHIFTTEWKAVIISTEITRYDLLTKDTQLYAYPFKNKKIKEIYKQYKNQLPQQEDYNKEDNDAEIEFIDQADLNEHLSMYY